MSVDEHQGRFLFVARPCPLFPFANPTSLVSPLLVVGTLLMSTLPGLRNPRGSGLGSRTNASSITGMLSEQASQLVVGNCTTSSSGHYIEQLRPFGGDSDTVVVFRRRAGAVSAALCRDNTDGLDTLA